MVLGQWKVVLVGTGSLQGGTGWNITELGQYRAVLVGTWVYWVSITWYCLVLGGAGLVLCLYILKIWSDVTIAGRTDDEQTRKDRATQPMDHGLLKWAIVQTCVSSSQAWVGSSHSNHQPESTLMRPHALTTMLHRGERYIETIISLDLEMREQWAMKQAHKTRCQIWCTIELHRDPISKVLSEW